MDDLAIEIAQESQGDVDIMSDAVGKMGRILDMVEKNVQISRNTKQV